MKYSYIEILYEGEDYIDVKVGREVLEVQDINGIRVIKALLSKITKIKDKTK